MTRIHTLPRTEARYDEASLWIAKLDKSLSAEDERALGAWMAADSQNKAVFLQMAKLWDKMNSLSRLSDLFAEPARQQRQSPRFALAMAASVLLAVLVGVWAVLDPEFADLERGEESTSTVAATAIDVYQTVTGEYSRVMLADGTELVLNTSTLVRINYTAKHRVLMLEHGELHIRVAKDPARPLSVIVAGNIVQAVGTEFNLEIKDDQKIELVVTEGTVRVGVHNPVPDTAVKNDAGKAEPVASPPALPASAVTLVAGEELILGMPEEEITDVSLADIEVKLSWQNGNLTFRGETLEEAVKEVERYTSVEFVFLDEDLKKVRIAGLFKTGDVNGLLAALRENFDIDYQRVDEKRVLLRTQ